MASKKVSPGTKGKTDLDPTAAGQLDDKDAQGVRLSDADGGDTDVLETPRIDEAAEEAAAKKSPPRIVEDTKRADIIAGWKDRREAGDLTSGSEDDAGAHEFDADEEDEDEGAEQAAPAVNGQADEPLFDITVNGVKKRLPQSEVIALAQKNAAADEALAQAKRATDEANALLANARNVVQPGSTGGNQPVEYRTEHPGHIDPNQPQTKVDPARYRSFIEKVQAGTEEDGAEATAELVTSIRNDVLNEVRQGQIKPEQILLAIDERLAENVTHHEINRALEHLADVSDDLVKRDPYMTKRIVDETIDRMRVELLGIGVPEEDLRNTTGFEQVQAYHRFRRDPMYAPKLTSLIDISDTVVANVRQQYGIAAPEPRPAPSDGKIVVSQERRDRKEATVQSQPRSAARPRMPAPPPPTAKKGMEFQGVVEKMRESRGQR